MSAANPKKHHFVPRMILKRFADSDGKFYHYTHHREEIPRVHISNAFCRNHLYATPPINGQRDVTLERRFAELEDVMSGFFDQLENTIIHGRYPKLRINEREALALFAYQQWRRVPDFHETVMNIDGCAAAIKEAISQFETEHRPLTREERDHYLTPEAAQRFRQQARVKALSSANRRTVEAIIDKGLFFALAPPRKSFIIASHPVLKISPHGATNELDDPMVEVWLPIHPKILMAFAGPPSAQGIAHLPEHDVRNYNTIVARRSTEFASTSLALVTSVLRRCGFR